MKQLGNKKLCKYCLGCNKLEYGNFIGVMRCKYFAAAQENWQEEWRKALKEAKDEIQF